MDALAMPLYRYALLLPAGAEGAEANNAPLLGLNTLGIEVTEAVLAERCGLGNIDPQHSSAASFTAIEAAADWENVPTPGAALVTIRPDLDAFGAMAVLTYRAEGRMLTPPMKARIRAVAAADRFDRGSWPGPQPWPDSPDDLIEDLGGSEVGMMSAAARDASASIPDRVRRVLDWLASGVIPEAYRRAPLERAGRLFRAIQNGEVLVDTSEAAGRLVEIVTEADGALGIGYRFAPVVVALNPHFAFPGGASGQKFTIAQYAPGYADLDAAIKAIRQLEPGWGGSATIKGSPQGIPSRLARAEVARLVANNLR